MNRAKEKLSNIGSAAKEKINIAEAKTEEKGAKAMARTDEEKRAAHEMRKAKEAQAKMELHGAKADHAQDNLTHHVHGHNFAGTAPNVPPTGTAAPTLPPATFPASHHKYV